MLSLLIPCYNYSCYTLVERLHHLCTAQDIEFEILVSEDGGNKYIVENSGINALPQATYILNKLNLGRAGNLNRLLNRAEFKSKLIIDCDLMPKTDAFISTYISIIKTNQPQVCFGGIAYEKSDRSDHLRYNYGIKREARSANDRLKTPYKSLLTSNLLIVNCQLHFDENITTYGYEDLVFAQTLKEHNIPVRHIDNPLMHLNLEDNSTYVKKTETALHTLIMLENEGFISSGLTRISALRVKFDKLYLSFILSLLYVLFGKALKRRIARKGRPLWVFDLYKLVYFNKHY